MQPAWPLVRIDQAPMKLQSALRAGSRTVNTDSRGEGPRDARVSRWRTLKPEVACAAWRSHEAACKKTRHY